VRLEVAMSSRFGGVFLFVQDVAASIAFYRDALGMQLHYQEGPAFAILGLGDFELMLHTDRADEDPEHLALLHAAERGVGLSLMLQVDDVDATHARLKAEGLPVGDVPSTQPWGRREIRLSDPDGYGWVLWSPIA
jgi:lactoylglutathione lyase